MSPEVRDGEVPAPGGPHDPDAPDKLGPLDPPAADADADADTETEAEDADDSGLPPDGDDPMEGVAPSG
jgi:hypothetical protein